MKMQRHEQKKKSHFHRMLNNNNGDPQFWPLPFAQQLETLNSETDDIRSPPFPDAVKILPSFFPYLQLTLERYTWRPSAYLEIKGRVKFFFSKTKLKKNLAVGQCFLISG